MTAITADFENVFAQNPPFGTSARPFEGLWTRNKGQPRWLNQGRPLT